jgi:murein endopeptidase
VSTAVAIALAGIMLGLSGPPPPADRHPVPRVDWRESTAVGTPAAGSLKHGVRFPASGRHFFTWDPILHRQPDRDWRRWGTDDLVRATLRVLREFGRRHPHAPRIGVGDLGLRHGGYFGPEIGGGIGHATHQNGLDVDVYYPRVDRRERAPMTVDQVDVRLSQALVDAFVSAGAETIYVGPNLPLTGPAGIVTPLVNHDNHLHFRISSPSG